MDIDVKNAYVKALNTYGAEHFEDFIAQTRKFISAISKNRAEERFDEFCNIYVRKEIDKSNLPKSSDGFVYSPAVIEFFLTLGKYYLFSRFDKKDIDKDRVASYIKELAKSNLKKPVSSISAATETVKKNEEQTESKNEVVESADEISEPEETLEELKNKLYSLVGLQGVKEEVDQIINLISLSKKAEELGEKRSPMSLHLVFYGNPGTGKTTVARLLAKIYKSLGVLSQGQLVEVDRGGLVGGYVGQTAIKTQEVINKAMGGILFIDEAYALTHGKGDSDFGHEAVEKILKAMEDHRDNFIVIVAGYPDLMKEFISSNPGLKSRFNQYIFFEDYTPEQLVEIFRLLCKNENHFLAAECDEYLLNYFEELYSHRDADYANGRDVRNYFEKVLRAQANRLSPIIDCVTREQYRTIELDDLKKAKEMKSSNW